MAYLLLITFLLLVQSAGNGAPFIVGMFFYQLTVGALCGFLLGKLAVRIINKVNISNDSLYPVLLLSMSFIVFFLTDLLKGNGFLAVYIGGITIGNSRFLHKYLSKSFFDGFAWMAQILMFLLFGMMIKPAELIPVAVVGLTIGLFVLVLARPLAVWGCLFPFKEIPPKAKFYVSWVGLRGAVPLIFATVVFAADIENGKTMFNIVFFVMLVSLLVQGSSVSSVARILGVGKVPADDTHFPPEETEMSDNIKSAITEITIEKKHLKEGDSLMTMQIPENTLVVMIKRGGRYFRPKGRTKIEEGDKLLLISDNEKTLCETCKKIGIRYIPFQKGRKDNHL
jgi:cell volume regulation protein A